MLVFKVLFPAHAPDAEPKKYRCVIETGKYKLFAVVVRKQKQAIEECKNHIKKEGIHSIRFCPRFINKNIAEIQEAVGEKGVYVSQRRQWFGIFAEEHVLRHITELWAKNL